MTRRFQFSLEKLLLVVAWLAIFCVVGPPIMEWRWGGISRERLKVIIIVVLFTAARFGPGIYTTVRAYQRFRDSEP